MAIRGLTANQCGVTATWVRIPHPPPKMKGKEMDTKSKPSITEVLDGETVEGRSEHDIVYDYDLEGPGTGLNKFSYPFLTSNATRTPEWK